MTRGSLNELILPTARNDFAPPVRSFLHKLNKYAQRGTRLIIYESLIEYLYRKADEADAEMDLSTAKEAR